MVVKVRKKWVVGGHNLDTNRRTLTSSKANSSKAAIAMFNENKKDVRRIGWKDWRKDVSTEYCLGNKHHFILTTPQWGIVEKPTRCQHEKDISVSRRRDRNQD